VGRFDLARKPRLPILLGVSSGDNVLQVGLQNVAGYSGEIDHHSALKPITIPEESDQASERSDAGFSIFPEGDRFRQV
jgi:hypothetical protein